MCVFFAGVGRGGLMEEKEGWFRLVNAVLYCAVVESQVDPGFERPVEARVN